MCQQGGRTPKFIIDNSGNVGIGTIGPSAKLHLTASDQNYSGTGDYSNMSGNQLTIEGTIGSNYWRVNHLSADTTISGVYNYQTGKNVYWGEAIDTGSYLFRGRNLIVSEGSVGIRTASPLATLDIRGNSATTPAASISAQSNFAGLVVDNSGSGDIFTASSSGMSRFTITQNGNVGIGTANPSTKLEISQSADNKGLQLNGYDDISSYNARMFIDQWGVFNINTTGATAYRSSYNWFDPSNFTGGYNLFSMAPTGHTEFRNGNNAAALYINSSGNIGINTASPLAKLDVRGAGTATQPIASLSGSTTFAGLIVDNSGSGDLFTASSSGLSRFVIKQNGNVGIGTAMPGGILDLSENKLSTYSYFVHRNTATGNVANQVVMEQRLKTDTTERAAFQINTAFNNITDASRNSLVNFYTANSGTFVSAMAINGANVGINTTSPLARLDVRGAGTATTPIASLSGSTNFAGLVVDNSGSGDLFTASSSGLSRFVITQGGNVGIGTTMPKSSLDINGTVNATKVYSGSAATAFGDSITVGVGASSASKNYVSLIGSETGWTMTNAGVSGSEMGNTAYTILSSASSTSSARSIFLSGYNDMRHYGSSTSGQQTFADAYRAALIWMAIPDSQKIIANNASVTKTGTWSTAANYNSFNGLGLSEYSSTVDDTAAVTLYGTTVYIGFTYRTNLGSGGTFEVLVDGVSYGTTDEMAGISPVDTPSYWPGAIRIGGLTPGPHQVVVKIKSSAATNIDWFASNDQLSGLTGPFVYAGGTLRMNTGYTMSPPWNNGSDAIVEQFNQIERQITSQLVADGLKVIYVDVNKYYNANTADMSDDFSHPSDQGYSKIANAFLDSMNSLTSPFERGGSFYASKLASYLQPYNGNIGINTSSALAKLDVRGAGSATQPIASLSGSTTFAGMVVDNSGSGDLFTASSSGLSRFVIQQNGNVGIGTNSVSLLGSGGTPTALQVHSAGSFGLQGLSTGLTVNGSFTGALAFGTTGTSASEKRSSLIASALTADSATNVSGDLQFWTNNAGTLGLKMYIDAAGNVGIGTTTPNNLLEVNKSVTGGTSLLVKNPTAGTGNYGNLQVDSDTVASQLLSFSSTWTTNGHNVQSGANLATNGSGGMSLSAYDAAGVIRLYTGGSAASNERMRITSTGSVGIGTTSPLARLDVRGAGTATSPIASLSGSTTFAGMIVDNSGTGDLFTASKSGAKKFTVLNNGNVEIVGTATTCTIGNGTSATNCSSSDIRLKDNITPLSEIKGLESIKLLSPVSYKWNSWMQGNGATGADQFGFIAQDVAKIFPNLVEQDKNTGYYKLDYQGLFAPLVKSIQELDIKVDGSGDLVSSLALRVDALEQQTTASPSATLNANNNLTIEQFNDFTASVSSELSSLQSEISALKSSSNLAMQQFNNLSNLAASDAAFLKNILSSPLFTALTASQSAGLQLALENLDVNNATVSGALSVLGRTTVSDLGVTGTLNAGLLTINGLDTCSPPDKGELEGVLGGVSCASLNTSSGPLRLQSHGLYGLDILDGKVTIAENGDIKTKGNITAKEITTETFKVLGDKTAGSALLPAGQTEIEISAQSATSSAKILLTPTTLTDKTLNVIEKQLGKFKVGITSPDTIDIKFDWFIIQ